MRDIPKGETGSPQPDPLDGAVEGMVLSALHRYTGSVDREERKDVRQIARMAAQRAMLEFRSNQGMEIHTFVQVKIRNAVIDAVRKITRVRRLLTLDAEAISEPSLRVWRRSRREPEPWRRLDRHLFWELVRKILHEPKLYRVIALTYRNDLDADAVAEKLGLRKRDHAARRAQVYRLKGRALEMLAESGERLRRALGLSANWTPGS